MSYYRNQLEAYLKMIDVKADKVLDVGGGANPVLNRVKSWEVGEYTIFDKQTEEQAPELARECDSLVVGDIEGVEVDLELVGKFDIVFCLEVMEYIANPDMAMESLCDFLKPDGILYISYPTIYPLHNPSELDMLRYSKNWIIQQMSFYFNVVEIAPRMATVGREALASFYRLEGMHPAKTSEVFNLGYIVKAIKK